MHKFNDLFPCFCTGKVMNWFLTDNKKDFNKNANILYPNLRFTSRTPTLNGKVHIVNPIRIHTWRLLTESNLAVFGGFFYFIFSLSLSMVVIIQYEKPKKKSMLQYFNFGNTPNSGINFNGRKSMWQQFVFYFLYYFY